MLSFSYCRIPGLPSSAANFQGRGTSLADFCGGRVGASAAPGAVPAVAPLPWATADYLCASPGAAGMSSAPRLPGEPGTPTGRQAGRPDWRAGLTTGLAPPLASVGLGVRRVVLVLFLVSSYTGVISVLELAARWSEHDEECSSV